MSKTEEAIRIMSERIDKTLQRAGMLVEADAKRNCPVDTGRLRASITTSPVEEHTVTIGTNTEYAPYVELGTCKMSAQPFLQPALDMNKQAILNMFKGIV